jgi:ATP-dependent Clp protease ATP-binding subunit ClpA
MGARPMSRVIHTHIKTPLADEVLFGRLRNGGAVHVVVVGGDKGEKKLGFVYPEGPVLPRPERDIIEAGKKRAPQDGEPRAERKEAAANEESTQEADSASASVAPRSVPDTPLQN